MAGSGETYANIKKLKQTSRKGKFGQKGKPAPKGTLRAKIAAINKSDMSAREKANAIKGLKQKQAKLEAEG